MENCNIKHRVNIYTHLAVVTGMFILLNSVVLITLAASQLPVISTLLMAAQSSYGTVAPDADRGFSVLDAEEVDELYYDKITLKTIGYKYEHVEILTSNSSEQYASFDVLSGYVLDTAERGRIERNNSHHVLEKPLCNMWFQRIKLGLPLKWLGGIELGAVTSDGDEIAYDHDIVALSYWPFTSIAVPIRIYITNLLLNIFIIGVLYVVALTLFKYSVSRTVADEQGV